jgi:hypothetical protein
VRTSVAARHLTLRPVRPSALHLSARYPTPARARAARSAAPDLAKGISDILGVPLGKATIGRFNDGECNIQLGENVRNTHVFLIQSTAPPVNDSLMELFLMVRACCLCRLHALLYPRYLRDCVCVRVYSTRVCTCLHTFIHAYVHTYINTCIPILRIGYTHTHT